MHNQLRNVQLYGLSAALLKWAARRKASRSTKTEQKGKNELQNPRRSLGYSRVEIVMTR